MLLAAIKGLVGPSGLGLQNAAVTSWAAWKLSPAMQLASGFATTAKGKKQESSSSSDSSSSDSDEEAVPKQPLNAYQLFIRQQMPKLKAENPSAKPTDLLSKIAASYKQQPSHVLAPLQAEAKRQKEAYAAVKPAKAQKRSTRAPTARNIFLQELAATKPHIPPGLTILTLSHQKWEALPESEKERLRQASAAMKAKRDAAKPPKKAAGPYAKFVKQEFAAARSEMGSATAPTEVVRDLAKRWRGMSEGEKASFK
mmetsp:Transcript_25868/g.65794  ORF Transcript_25868/g.65794 Transcript_25868/m.65794 type:complete len:255 (-) Transcript_25868:530-1294(-)